MRHATSHPYIKALARSLVTHSKIPAVVLNMDEQGPTAPLPRLACVIPGCCWAPRPGLRHPGQHYREDPTG